MDTERNIKNKDGKNLVRQESYKYSILCFVLGVLFAVLAVKGTVSFLEGTKGGLAESALLLAVQSVFSFILGARYFYRTKKSNKILKNNMLSYNFDYVYELAVYKNIGDTAKKKKKICNVEIRSFLAYTEWRDYIVNTYIEDGGIIKSQLENFKRFLNKKLRLVRLEKEIYLNVSTPIMIALVAIVCSGCAIMKSGGFTCVALGMIEAVVVAFFTILDLYQYNFDSILYKGTDTSDKKKHKGGNNDKK